jgi:hypothetical protein
MEIKRKFQENKIKSEIKLNLKISNSINGVEKIVENNIRCSEAELESILNSKEKLFSPN